MSKKSNSRKKNPEKFDWVKKHLLRYRSLDAFRAIDLYNVTRLAAYIHKLRNKTGPYKWNIRTVDVETRNKSGRYGVHAKYFLLKTPKIKK